MTWVVIIGKWFASDWWLRHTHIHPKKKGTQTGSCPHGSRAKKNKNLWICHLRSLFFSHIPMNVGYWFMSPGKTSQTQADETSMCRPLKALLKNTQKKVDKKRTCLVEKMSIPSSHLLIPWHSPSKSNSSLTFKKNASTKFIVISDGF